MRKIYLIIVLFLAAVNLAGAQQLFTEQTLKMARAMALIDGWYVDSTNQEKLTEKAIIAMLKELDPHSVYYSSDEVKEMNEGLEGNFEGIGIQFNILYDSVIVISPVPGGPSEKAGLRAGDRIVTIEGENVAGVGISTNGVRKRLLGESGSRVEVGVYRRGRSGIINFTIIRDKIPVNSLDAAYMLDNQTGYIKLNKFAATTEQEFNSAVERLQRSKMKNLVIDLRGNTGGYLEAAIRLSDHLFSERKLVVYLEGLKTPRQEFVATGNGNLASAKVVILVDEGSASASEIMAGAVQDWDRGVIIGRRTFGKGLVQNGFYLQDGSMIRLTIARYYTPTGRLIQRPYEDGIEKYITDYYSRYTNGEMLSADSISFPDSLRVKTLLHGRDVFGGGGIMPDIFVPVDTSWYSDYYRDLVSSSTITEYTLDYVDRNRKMLTRKYSGFAEFRSGFEFTDEDVKSFTARGEKLGVKFDSAGFETSREQLLKVLKGLVARDLWDMSEYYEIVNSDDATINRALEVINNEELYRRILGSSPASTGL